MACGNGIYVASGINQPHVTLFPDDPGIYVACGYINRPHVTLLPDDPPGVLAAGYDAVGSNPHMPLDHTAKPLVPSWPTGPRSVPARNQRRRLYLSSYKLNPTEIKPFW